MGDEAEYLNDGGDYIIGEPEPQGNFKLTKMIKGEITYRCTRCGQYKVKKEYYTDKRNPCGIRNKCKKCYHK